MRAVDTNVLVRLFVRDDDAQCEAAETFIEFGAWVSHLVLAETVWVLQAVYQSPRKALIAALELLLSHERLTLEDRDVVAKALQRFGEHPKVGFTDCLALEIARKAGHTPLGSFDKALTKIEGTEAL